MFSYVYYTVIKSIKNKSTQTPPYCSSNPQKGEKRETEKKRVRENKQKNNKVVIFISVITLNISGLIT